MSVYKNVLKHTYDYFQKLGIQSNGNYLDEIIYTLQYFNDNINTYYHYASLIEDNKPTKPETINSANYHIKLWILEYSYDRNNFDYRIPTTEEIRESIEMEGIHSRYLKINSRHGKYVYWEGDEFDNNMRLVEIIVNRFSKYGIEILDVIIDETHPSRDYIIVHESYIKKIIEEFGNYNFIDWYRQFRSDRIKWDADLLRIMKEKLCWINVSSNSNFYWSYEIIFEFRNEIKWSCLCELENVDWSISILRELKNYIKWNILLNNHSVNWDIDLILEFSSFFDWHHVFNSTTIKWDINAIEKVWEKLSYSMSHRISLGRNPNLIISDKLLEKYPRNILPIKFGATKFEWDLKMVEIYLPNIFKVESTTKEFLSNAVIDEQVVIYYEKMLDQNIDDSFLVRRNSDGTRRYYRTFDYWHYLNENENMVWTDELIKRYIEKIRLKKGMKFRLSVELINYFWEYEQKGYYHHLENYDGHSEFIPPFKFKEVIMKCEILNLSFDEFKQFEIKWWNYLIADNFINESIKNMLIRHYS